MMRLLLTTVLISLYGYSNTAEYFPDDMNHYVQPTTVNVDVPFATPMDISMYVRKPIIAYDEFNQATTLPLNAEIMIQTTLNQIYEGFKRPLETQSLYSRDSMVEQMRIESPEALQLKQVLVELIEIKRQEQIIDRLGGSATSKERDELVEVKVKKEGELKTVKVDLEKAIKDEAVVVKDEEAFSVRLPTDYNGSENWQVTPQTEAGDIIKCTVCGTQPRDTLATELQNQATNELIKSKAHAYSTDTRTKKND